ncbi:alkaline phosphatase family protein [Pacificibacter sp. AS14]|uniref:alkaline phosphatase family protein n=1 Tax=Pacificibacter sp. AS14 TaxID=3135785 RepID=UPI003175AFE8
MTQVDRVVIVVFDALRPDMIAGRMPHLESFASQSLWFREARSVFPSMTRVATTSFATGGWPAQHGIINNSFHLPHVMQGMPVDTSNFDHLTRLKTSQGQVVTMASLGHALAAAGKRMGAVHCGTAGAAYLVNHDVAAHGHWTFSIHGEASTQTPGAVQRAVALHGALPDPKISKFTTLDYAESVFIDMALAEDGPDVALMWLPEPDTTWHKFGLGSGEARRVMAAADKVFANVLDAVQSRGGRTAVIAMSDHGQITMTKRSDICAEMLADGLPAHHHPGKEHRLALTQGNMGELRSLDGDKCLIADACDWLMSRDDIGMVFARDDMADALPGTLPMSLVQHGHDRSPELFFLMRSSEEADHWGLPGSGGLMAGVELGCGMHGGLNRYEMNTTLIVNTPDGRRGLDAMPVGLVDIAPTVCDLLDTKMIAAGHPLPLFEPATSHVVPEVFRDGRGPFMQELRRHNVDGRVYLDNGARVTE